MKHCFTLVELLAVIGIVAILVGITVGGLSFATAKADESKTIALMEEFETALEKYKEDYGVYPIQATAGNVDFAETHWHVFTNQSAESPTSKPNKRNKPYMEGIRNLPIDGDGHQYFEDAYGNVFQYEYPNSVASRNTTKYALWSKGKDGSKTTGTTDDDICSWKQK